jgi:hypothetical protein
MEIDNLIIEATRRCNLKCEHCLRGKAQCMDMSPDILSDFIKKNKVTGIYTLTFTGGEPSLNPEIIFKFIEICKLNKVSVGNFYIATNGTGASDQFIKALIELYLFCTDNEISRVEVSRTDYHHDQDEDAINKLKVLKFVQEKGRLEYHYVIAEGRGKYLTKLNGTFERARRIKPSNLVFNGDDIREGEVYLNCKGDILTSRDLSYQNQDKYKLGNLKDGTIKELAIKAGLYEEEK